MFTYIVPRPSSTKLRAAWPPVGRPFTTVSGAPDGAAAPAEYGKRRIAVFAST